MDAHLVLPIKKLQPTRRLDPRSLAYFRDLSIHQMRFYGCIYVLRTDLGDLITEGHNRAAILAKRRIKELDVCAIDFGGAREGRTSILNYYVNEARKLREEGITTLYDLWQA